MKRFHKTQSLIISVLSVTAIAANVAAQTRVNVQQPVSSSGDMWMYVAIFMALLGLSGTYYFWKRSRKTFEAPKADKRDQYSDYSYQSNGSFEMGDLDADRELEWLRKKKTAKSKSRGAANGTSKKQAQSEFGGTVDTLAADTKIFQEKMKMQQYAQLPINSFNALAPAKSFEPLPESQAAALLEALKQSSEEFEPDESIRDLAVKTLSSFRTMSAVEALSQVALYDLSSTLRSRAVSILTDFDHESVFESVLLACADPTREVRAAAARGLFRLNFDRSGAWKRIIETKDEFRMSQAARAAVEAGIVTKSFDRLIHDDIKIAYEAFTLVALMIKSGENKEIFEAIKSHKDERVKFALLHVLKVVKDERSLNGLNDVIKSGSFSNAVKEKMNDVVKSLSSHAKSTV